MSFHRVLPLLPGLSNQELQDRWAKQRDILVASKIMPESIAVEGPPSRNSDIAKSTVKKVLPPYDEDPAPIGKEEQEDDSSQGYHGPSLSQTPDASSRPTKTIEISSSEEALDGWQGESPSSICLCQPDPKVPRPRNAFILYRQHNQAGVVQQNPGLANPEISKIIGDHWRNLSPEEKNHWKLLAEEEKIRHSKQYPDYRYQPRRSGRVNSITAGSQPSSTETSPKKCHKCGGRSIATSSMMTNAVSFNQNMPVSTPYSPKQGIGTPGSGGASQFRGLNLNSPANANLPTGQRSRPSTTSGGGPLRLVSPPYRRMDERDTSPGFKRPDNNRPFLRSPESKRRRITQSNYAPIRGPSGPTTPFPYTAPGRSRGNSLPRPEFMGPGAPSPVTMGPPPRPHNTQHGPLTLAPIQSTNPEPMQLDTQEKSLEAMVLSIPTLGKIKVLERISSPLAPPGPTSPARQTRGVVIAIDAADQASIQQLTQTLSSSLLDFSPRVFVTPTPPTSAPASFQTYLRLIDQYHTLSAQVIDYITTLPSPPPPTQPETSPEPLSPKSFPKDLSNKNHSAAEESVSIPVAIIPGFQVTWSDWFASHVSISDAYSPMDHWQWGATLWRKVVGADVTVAVQAPNTAVEDSLALKTPSVDKGEGARKMTFAAGGGGGNGARNAASGVDVKLEDSRAVIVKGCEGGGLPEGGLRRVGFEIGEWVRVWSEREREKERRVSLQA